MTGNRRAFLIDAACIGLVGLPVAGLGAQSPRRPAQSPLAPLLPGVYTAIADVQPPPFSAAVVAVGGDGVLVIDPGPHLRQGRRLLAAIRELTALPVRWVVNTHPHPHQVLANAAFAELRPRPAFLASPRTAERMRLHCAACLRSLAAELGREAMAGTSIVLPRPALHDGATLDAGGLRWQVRVFADAHSVSDTALYAPSHGLLCAGELTVRERVPDLRDGSLRGWRAALDALAVLPAKCVAGAGSGTPQQTIAPTRAYLDYLEGAIGRALTAGVDAAGALGAVPGDAFRHWRGFDPRHALNVQRAWLELEDAWMRAAPAG